MQRSKHSKVGTAFGSRAKSPEQWQLFDQTPDDHFASVTHINNGEGIWVKSDKEQVIPISDTLAKLHNFKTLDDLKESIKERILLGNQNGGYIPIIAYGVSTVETIMADGAMANQKQASDAPTVSDATDTNIQEAGVDESDIIKHNKTHIFYLSNDKNNFESLLNVTSFQAILSGNHTPLHQIKVKGYANDLYLAGDKLVIISRKAQRFKPMLRAEKDQASEDQKETPSTPADMTPTFYVTLYDISNIDAIKPITQFKIEGNLNNSRLIGDKLYLISSFRPILNYAYPKIYQKEELEQECKYYFHPSYTQNTPTFPAKCYFYYKDENGSFRYDYEHPNITFKRLLPNYTQDENNPKLLIDPARTWASNKKDQDISIVSVGVVNLDQAVLQKTSSLLANPYIVYASQKALYLVSNNYPDYLDFERYRYRSAIYKFDLDDTLAYEAYGFVKGRANNQFSLSEQNDILRIATTQGNSWEENTNNALYTLKSIDHLLVIQGVLEGLGKKGETIYGVRFVGDIGFVVTAKQTDPLYTLDLSDPAHPKKVGELEVSGFSSYLHPLNKDLILGFGRDLTPDGRRGELKLDLYDVDDLENPKLVARKLLPRGSYSPLEYDHKALTWRASDDLFGFPYSNQKAYFGLYKISGSNITTY